MRANIKCPPNTMNDLPPNQQIVSLNENILGDHGIELHKDDFVLDFGCGSGRHVHEHIDHGYSNSFGYDVRQVLDLRDPADEARFRFDASDRMTRIPFPDDHFDFVYSYSVFEHVLDQEKSFREINRVLKPGGISLHNFPSKWRPLEPHLFVPFGGAFRSYAYYRFWITLGIGTKIGGGYSRLELADKYAEYGRSGLYYPEGTEIDAVLRRCFDRFAYVSKSFLRFSPGRAHYLYPLIKAMPFLEKLFELMHTRMVLLEKAPLRAVDD